MRLIFFGSLFDILVLVEFVLDVAEVSPSSAFLAWLISKIKKMVTLFQFHSFDQGNAHPRVSWSEE